MAGGLSSPELLRELWQNYVERYMAQMPHSEPTMRRTSRELGWDESALAKWMQSNTPNHKRIPLERIAQLGVGLMLVQDDVDRLMATRIEEMCAADPGVKAAIDWAVEAMHVQARSKYALNGDEIRVLAAFRAAAENYPRGLYCDDDEPQLMLAQMQVLLERAEELASEEDSIEQPSTSIDQSRLAAILDQLRESPAYRDDGFRFKDALKQATQQFASPDETKPRRRRRC
jgi:hypothetical protein